MSGYRAKWLLQPLNGVGGLLNDKVSVSNLTDTCTHTHALNACIHAHTRNAQRHTRKYKEHRLSLWFKDLCYLVICFVQTFEELISCYRYSLEA